MLRHDGNDHSIGLEEARGWIAKLVGEGPTYYGLRNRSTELQQAITRSGDMAAAIDALALFGTPASQLARWSM